MAGSREQGWIGSDSMEEAEGKKLAANKAGETSHHEAGKAKGEREGVWPCGEDCARRGWRECGRVGRAVPRWEGRGGQHATACGRQGLTSSQSLTEAESRKRRPPPRWNERREEAEGRGGEARACITGRESSSSAMPSRPQLQLGEYHFIGSSHQYISIDLNCKTIKVKLHQIVIDA